MQPMTTGEKFWFVAKSVLKSPISVLMWIVAGAVAFYTMSHGLAIWWLPFVFALLGEAGLLFNALHDEKYLHDVFQKRQVREEIYSEQKIEELLEKMDFETRQRLRYILQLQKEVAREARSEGVSDYARRDMESIANQLPILVQKAVRIALSKQDLSRYLQNVDERALKNYCNTLRTKIATASDSVTKQQYEQALRAREAELETYQSIAQQGARIDSQLENVEATFASWKARMIRIKTADVAGAASVRDGLLQELDMLNGQIDLLDTSVAEALSGEEELQQSLGRSNG